MKITGICLTSILGVKKAVLVSIRVFIFIRSTAGASVERRRVLSWKYMSWDNVLFYNRYFLGVEKKGISCMLPPQNRIFVLLRNFSQNFPSPSVLFQYMGILTLNSTENRVHEAHWVRFSYLPSAETVSCLKPKNRTKNKCIMSPTLLALEVPLHRHKISTSQMFLDANRTKREFSL